MKILHIDIETKPHVAYVWGLWGVNVGINQIVQAGSTMCWAAKWHGKRGIKFSSEFEVSHKEMIQGAWELLDEADIVCHYNGKKFDIPTLNKEFILYDLPPPTPFRQIDLLQTARRQFRLASNKLDYVAQFLGLGSKTKHMGMDLWHDCMQGDKKAWALMKKYNIQDVNLLELLYEKLLEWIPNHPNVAAYVDSEKPMCRACGSEDIKKNGIETTNTGQYQRYRCNGCKRPLRGKTQLMSLEKRRSLLV